MWLLTMMLLDCASGCLCLHRTLHRAVLALCAAAAALGTPDSDALLLLVPMCRAGVEMEAGLPEVGASAVLHPSSLPHPSLDAATAKVQLPNTKESV